MNNNQELNVGDKAPEFCLPDHTGKEICLNNFKGRWVILYFYPKDNTSGCTMEAIDFTEHLKDFEKLDAVVLGTSPDSIKSHQKFIEKHNLKVILLSDPEHKVLKKYGVWKLKRMYRREYYGVIRSTFIIDPEGYIRYIWKKVKVKGHVNDVINKLSEIRNETKM